MVITLMRLRVGLTGAVVALLAVAVGSALAATQSSNFSVSASVANVCTIGTTNISFGAYDPIVSNASTPLDANGTVTITCTKGAATTLGVSLGSNASGSTRRMTDGTNFLTYEIFKPPSTTPNAACSYSSPSVWGTAGGDLFAPADAPSKAARTYNTCGRVPAGQDVPAASYSDAVVTATVNF